MPDARLSVFFVAPSFNERLPHLATHARSLSVPKLKLRPTCAMCLERAPKHTRPHKKVSPVGNPSAVFYLWVLHDGRPLVSTCFNNGGLPVGTGQPKILIPSHSCASSSLIAHIDCYSTRQSHLSGRLWALPPGNES